MPKPPGGGLVSRLLTTVLALTVVTGCTGGPEPDAVSSGPSAPATRTAERDLAELPVPRDDVCDRLSRKAVEQTLSAPVAGSDHYSNGDEVEVAPGRTDVVHEYGCTYHAADGSTARFWVFAPPLSSSDAEVVVRRARRERGCSFPGRGSFGEPSLTSVCEAPGGDRRREDLLRVRMQGLFGESWVGCEVAVPEGSAASSAEDRPGRSRLVRRTRHWCSEAVVAVSDDR